MCVLAASQNRGSSPGRAWESLSQGDGNGTSHGLDHMLNQVGSRILELPGVVAKSDRETHHELVWWHINCRCWYLEKI